MGDSHGSHGSHGCECVRNILTGSVQLTSATGGPQSEGERRGELPFVFICCGEERERERDKSLWSDCVLTPGLICLQLGPV